MGVLIDDHIQDPGHYLKNDVMSCLKGNKTNITTTNRPPHWGLFTIEVADYQFVYQILYILMSLNFSDTAKCSNIEYFEILECNMNTTFPCIFIHSLGSYYDLFSNCLNHN